VYYNLLQSLNNQIGNNPTLYLDYITQIHIIIKYKVWNIVDFVDFEIYDEGEKG
jgi:hypothetical protein